MQDHSSADVQDAILWLDAEADAPAVARGFLAEHRDHLAQDLFEDAELLLSEVVTNAVQHGRTAIALRVRASPPGIGIAVADLGSDLPDPSARDLTTDLTATSGRGLAIIAALASAWGVVPTEPPPGKTRWFELHATE